jgi:hypothetical protein
MSKMTGWRVFYDGGRVYDSRTHSWARMPKDGVQIVVVYRDQGYRTIEGCDLYFKAGDVIGGSVCPFDTPETIKKRYPGASVKLGRWTSDEELTRLQAEAREAR